VLVLCGVGVVCEYMLVNVCVNVRTVVGASTCMREDESDV
jgi:hypothetical protein